MTAPAPRIVTAQDFDRDLGFGTVVSRESRRRLLNRDGSFNVRRTGLRWVDSLSPYHWLLTMSWPRFLALATAFWIALNGLFALLYLACGDAGIFSRDPGVFGGRFWQAFFFSVQTLATIGYGEVTAHGVAANLVVTAEAWAGVLGPALVTGLLFARFSRPAARIVFSRRAVVAPYQDGRALMFRIANGRRSEMTELEVKAILTLRREGTAATRDYFPLALERPRVSFFPLAWTVVHPIDDASPLAGMTPERLAAAEGELLVLLAGMDDAFSQTLHARTSYAAEDVAWGARFRSIFEPPEPDGVLKVDISRLDEVDVLDVLGAEATALPR